MGKQYSAQDRPTHKGYFPIELLAETEPGTAGQAAVLQDELSDVIARAMVHGRMNVGLIAGVLAGTAWALLAQAIGSQDAWKVWLQIPRRPAA